MLKCFIYITFKKGFTKKQKTALYSNKNYDFKLKFGKAGIQFLADLI